MLGLTLYLMGLLSGCNTSRNDPFIDLYRIPSSNYKHAIQSTANKKKVSVSFNNMPFLSFIRWFSDSTNFGVIFPPDLESKTITGEYKNATAAEIISTVARRFDLSVVYIGKTIYLGKLTKDDRGILVRKVKNFDSQSLSDALQIYLSESGKIKFLSDYILVSDVAVSLAKIQSLLDQLDYYQPDTWIVQYYMLLKKNNIDVSGGAQVTTSGELSYNIAKGQGVTGDFTDIGQNFKLILNGNSSFVHVVASPLLMMTANKIATWTDATTVPIPRKTVSDAGTVTTTGVDYKDVGLTLKVTLQESANGVALHTDLEDSSIVGYVDYYPQTQKASLITDCNIIPGQIYLIGELRRDSGTTSISDVLTLGKKSELTNMQVYCRVFKLDFKNPFNDPQSIQNRIADPDFIPIKKSDNNN